MMDDGGSSGSSPAITHVVVKDDGSKTTVGGLSLSVLPISR